MFRKCQTITQDQVSVFWQVFDDSEPACENWIKHKIFGASLYYLPETKGPLVQAFAKISAKQTLPSFKTKVLKTVQNTEQIQREEEEKTKLAQAQLSNRSEEIGSMINIEIMVCKNQMEEELEELVLKIGLKQKEATKVETIMLELQEEIQACQRAIEAIKMADVSIEVDLDKSHEAQRGFSFPHTRSSMGPIFEPTTEFSNLLEKFNQAFQIFQEEASTIVNQAMDLAEKLFNACLRLWQSMKENEDVADQIELIKSEQASLAHFLENARNSF